MQPAHIMDVTRELHSHEVMGSSSTYTGETSASIHITRAIPDVL